MASASTGLRQPVGHDDLADRLVAIHPMANSSSCSAMATPGGRCRERAFALGIRAVRLLMRSVDDLPMAGQCDFAARPQKRRIWRAAKCEHSCLR